MTVIVVLTQRTSSRTWTLQRFAKSLGEYAATINHHEQGLRRTAEAAVQPMISTGFFGGAEAEPPADPVDKLPGE